MAGPIMCPTLIFCQPELHLDSVVGVVLSQIFALSGLRGGAVGALADGTSGLGLLGVDGGILLGVVGDGKTEAGGVDVAVAPDQQSAENRLGKQVEDTVEVSLAVGRDDIATLAETPSKRVQDPKDGGEGAAGEEGPTNVAAEGLGAAAGFPDENIQDVEEGDAAKDKIAPLVAAEDKSTNETVTIMTSSTSMTKRMVGVGRPAVRRRSRSRRGVVMTQSMYLT